MSVMVLLRNYLATDDEYFDKGGLKTFKVLYFPCWPNKFTICTGGDMKMSRKLD